MGKEGTPSQWKSILFGALIGVISALSGSYFTSYFQQQTLDEQQAEELNNIASALYTDITIAEIRLSKALDEQSKAKENPLYVLGSPFVVDLPYYPKNGLFYIFGKDISRFDKKTSRDLYAFYNNILELENRREFNERVLRGELTSQYDKLLAPIYTNESFNLTPIYIKNAEELRRNLSQRYFIPN